MKIVIVGHSHIACMQRAPAGSAGPGCTVEFLQLRNRAFSATGDVERLAQFDQCSEDRVREAVATATAGADLTVLCPVGNEHIVHSLRSRRGGTDEMIARLERGMWNYRSWIAALARCVPGPAAVAPPPPPCESEAHIRQHPGRFAERIAIHGVTPASSRLAVWRRETLLIREMAAEMGLHYIELPPRVFTESGYLQECFLGNDPSHGNEAYGELILRHIAGLATSLASAPAGSRRVDGRRHPYANLPDRAFWKQAVAAVPARQLDPVTSVPFTIGKTDKVATAGSCFAQHISRALRSAGFEFLVTEESPGRGAPEAGSREHYDFSARYGNIYTARQLLQLFDRAFGEFTPAESAWTLPGNRYCDPFRPRIEPEGYATVEALLADRERHLAAVREMFKRLDVLVFTLGLTECWVSRLDGAAYPIAPGVAGGEYDPARHEFVNFGVQEVISDLRSFLRKIRAVNPAARSILTVSPVPLVATYEPSHVLVSTTYSKSVLRVAAEEASRSEPGVCYFPSFEIVSGSYSRGRYFAPDLRSVTQEGVDHVMSVFMRHFAEGAMGAPQLLAETEDDEAREIIALAEAACDEELLQPGKHGS